MIDLTGDYLLTYLVREVRDIVSKHPRFRSAGGDAVAQSSNGVQFRDCRVEVSNITSQGNRLSPDYFMYYQKGHSVLGKLPNKDGVLVEWVSEVKGYTFTPAVYYLYVDSVDEKTRDVSLLVKQFLWVKGNLPTPAKGSVVYFNPATVDVTRLGCSDPALTWNTNVTGSFITLKNLPAASPLTWTDLRVTPTPRVLTPLVDYWILTPHSVVLGVTLGGHQTIYHTLPNSPFTLTDDTGYLLRENVDYWVGGGVITLNDFTPPGRTISANYEAKTSPADPVHPENRIPIQGNPVIGSVWINTSGGVYGMEGLASYNGQLYLRTLLLPGWTMQWDIKVEGTDAPVVASKQATNTNIIPGLVVALGDKVEVGDEVAIVVNPQLSECYEVFGSTENVSFTIKVVANDRDTVSDISGMIKEYLLVRDRDRHESSGLTIYQASTNSTTEPRDESGLHMRTTRELSFEAAADWRYFKPLVSTLTQVDISQVTVTASLYPYNAQVRGWASGLGMTSWQ